MASLVSLCLQWGTSLDRALRMEDAFLYGEDLGISLSLPLFTQFTITFKVQYFKKKKGFNILITNTLTVAVLLECCVQL